MRDASDNGMISVCVAIPEYYARPDLTVMTLFDSPPPPSSSPPTFKVVSWFMSSSFRLIERSLAHIIHAHTKRGSVDVFAHIPEYAKSATPKFNRLEIDMVRGMKCYLSVSIFEITVKMNEKIWLTHSHLLCYVFFDIQ